MVRLSRLDAEFVSLIADSTYARCPKFTCELHRSRGAGPWKQKLQSPFVPMFGTTNIPSFFSMDRDRTIDLHHFYQGLPFVCHTFCR